MSQNQKIIKFSSLVQEVQLDVTRRVLNKKTEAPSKELVKEIIKSYEDLIILYLTTDHAVQTRMGKWHIMKKTFTHLYGKAIIPVTKYLPQLKFAKRIKQVVEDSTEQLDHLRDTEKIIPADQDHVDSVQWELKDPQRDSLL